ncbi:hypothetical protein LZ31DRAFT_339848 [Colletotrichum somersetense]|nr:hypothetical protein LZ31DRAFT_339848 [Colletotrichum somersetense]
MAAPSSFPGGHAAPSLHTLLSFPLRSLPSTSSSSSSSRQQQLSIHHLLLSQTQRTPLSERPPTVSPCWLAARFDASTSLVAISSVTIHK